MSFYRTLLAAVAAVAIAAPVFADDTANTMQAPADNTTATQSTDTTTAQPVAGDQSAAASTTETKVNLNKATAKELMKVKGISAANARAIIAYRKSHKTDGGFKSVDELAKVKGFKKMKSDKLQLIEDQVSVD